MDLAIKMGRNNEKFLRSSHRECYILRVFFTVVNKFFLSVTLNNILRVKAIHAVVIKKEEISGVNWFLNLKISFNLQGIILCYQT